jgi:hypothetical protein
MALECGRHLKKTGSFIKASGNDLLIILSSAQTDLWKDKDSPNHLVPQVEERYLNPFLGLSKLFCTCSILHLYKKKTRRFKCSLYRKANEVG